MTAKNSIDNIIMEHYENGTSPLKGSTVIQNEKIIMDMKDIKNFFINKRVGKYITEL